jgi:hypothetical protein
VATKTKPKGPKTAMRRSVAVLAMVALFLSGVLVGILATHAFYIHRLERDGGIVGLTTELFGKGLERHLSLDGSQKRRLDVILADTRRDLASLHREVAPRAFAVLRQMQHRIEAMLSREQREEYQKLRDGPLRRIHELLIRRG